MSWQTRVERHSYQVKSGGDLDKKAKQTKTEVVWKDSREVGMARAKTPDGKSAYVVSRYRPAGNITGKFGENVFPSSTKDVNPPSFMDSKSTTEQSRVVKYSSGNPDGIQTRVVVKETRIQTPQGIKTMKSTYTTSSSSTSTSSGTTSDLGQFSNRKFKDTKWEDPSPRFKSLNISDVRNDRSNSRSFNDKSNNKSQPRDSSDRATSKQSSAPSGSFEKQAVDVHNKYRRLHQVPAVRWNSELARDAQVWADKIARQNSLQHASSQQRKGDGENLAMFSGRYENAAEEAINMWYGEEKSYRYGNASFKSGTGHFTQVVWKGSKEIGMARAKTLDGRATYVVARYRPAGNMLGNFKENVFPPRR